MLCFISKNCDKAQRDIFENHDIPLKQLHFLQFDNIFLKMDWDSRGKPKKNTLSKNTACGQGRAWSAASSACTTRLKLHYISMIFELEEQLSKVIQMDERHLASCVIKWKDPQVTITFFSNVLKVLYSSRETFLWYIIHWGALITELFPRQYKDAWEA